MLQSKTAHYDILRHIGILILVNKHILELCLILLKHLGSIAQQDVCLEQQVVEIHRTIALTTLTVVGIYLAKLGHLRLTIFGTKRAICYVCTWCNKAVFSHRDTRGNRLWLISLLGKIALLDDALNKVFHIVGLVYGVALWKAYTLGIFAQQSRKHRVECAHTYKSRLCTH